MPASSLGTPALDAPAFDAEGLPPLKNGARERLTRLLYLAVGTAAVIFGMLSLQTFLAQANRSSPALPILAWLLVFGLPVVAGILSRRAPLPVLRVLAIAEGAAFVTILILWLVLWHGPLPAGADIPWVLTLTGVPAVAVAIVARGSVAWAYAVLVCAMSGTLRAATSVDPYPVLVGAEDALYSLLLVSVFVGLTLAARRGAARIEATVLTARAADAARAARRARKQERQTINALVHDSVISTLLMAGLGRVEPGVVARKATSTLEQLDALRAPTPQPVVLRSELARRLERLSNELAPDAVFRVEAGAERTFPTDVVAAILGAVGEAIRNSVVSAGVAHRRPVARRVTVRSDAGRFFVTVHDDGVGFDPAAVPAERLGIAQSIVGRMGLVPGGAAMVRSRPGHGAEVEVSWAPSAGDSASAAASSPTAAAPAVPLVTGATASVAAAVVPRAAPAPNPVYRLAFSGTIGLSTAMARGIVALFIVVHGVLAFSHTGPRTSLPLDVLAWLAVSAAAVWVMSVAPAPLPRRCAFGVLALSAVSAALMFAQVRPVDAQPFAHWHIGAITLLLLVLVARGRTGLAWCGYAGLAAAGVAWAVANGLTIGDGVGLVIRHAGTLLAGTLFSVSLRRLARTLSVLIRERDARAACKATAGAASAERQAQLARINSFARPALERLSLAHEPDAAERAECLLVEASLRDAIRARCLFIEPVIRAARATRARGVEVTLLDDSGDQPPTEVTVLARVVADELDAVTSGRFTARVLPAGRADLATIVVDSTEHRILLVAPDGSVREA